MRVGGTVGRILMTSTKPPSGTLAPRPTPVAGGRGLPGGRGAGVLDGPPRRGGGLPGPRPGALALRLANVLLGQRGMEASSHGVPLESKPLQICRPPSPNLKRIAWGNTISSNVKLYHNRFRPPMPWGCLGPSGDPRRRGPTPSGGPHGGGPGRGPRLPPRLRPQLPLPRGPSDPSPFPA